MLGMLQEVLRTYAIATRRRITGELLIFLVDLRSIPAHTCAWAVAVEGLISGVAGLASAAAP
jgi:hypothetical protein